MIHDPRDVRAIEYKYHNRQKRPVLLAEVFTKPSLTIPDQVMTPKEILARYMRGQSIDVNAEGVYLDDPNTIGIEKLSRIEAAELAHENAQQLQGLERDYTEQFKLAQQAVKAHKQNSDKSKDATE